MGNYVTVTSDKSKTAALVCCLLGFLGFGGIHRFYVGKIGTGLLYFFTCGFLLLGTIFDLLKIISGTFTDGAGAALRK